MKKDQILEHFKMQLEVLLKDGKEARFFSSLQDGKLEFKVEIYDKTM